MQSDSYPFDNTDESRNCCVLVVLFGVGVKIHPLFFKY